MSKKQSGLSTPLGRSALARRLAGDRFERARLVRALGLDVAARWREDELEAAIEQAIMRNAIALDPRSELRIEAPPPSEREDDELPEGIGVHWVEIELIGEDDRPIPGARYEIKDPDGRTHRGRLDGDGRARVSGIKSAGGCEITFPELDEEAWEPA